MAVGRAGVAGRWDGLGAVGVAGRSVAVGRAGVVGRSVAVGPVGVVGRWDGLERTTGFVGVAACVGSTGVAGVGVGVAVGTAAFAVGVLVVGVLAVRGEGDSGTAVGLETTRVGIEAEIGPCGLEGTTVWRPVDVRERTEPDTSVCSPVVSGMMRRTRVGGDRGLVDGGGAVSSMMRGSMVLRPVIGIIEDEGATVVASSMMRGTTAWRPVAARTLGTRPDGGWSISSGSVRRVR